MAEYSAQLLNNLAQFHFLRPLWLLAIPAGLLLVIIFWRRKSSALNWGQAINPSLLSHLIAAGQDKISNPNRWPWLVLFCAWLIAALAMAGPTWQKLPQPVHERQDALAIVLDLSLSMYSQDIKPSRLVRARHKVTDILKTRSEGLSALIAYSRDAHVVSPFTDDNNTVANLVPALSPEMMPALGSNPAAAIATAIKLFKNSGLNEGRILLISDGISEQDSDAISELLAGSAVELSIMAVATPTGAPIPLSQGFVKDRSGNIVTPQLERGPFQQLAANTQGRYIETSLDNSDINFLLATSSSDLNTATRKTERQFDQWQDQGAYLCLLLLPLALLAFRRGWLLLLPLFIVLEPQQSQALEWQDLWKTPNQQAMQMLQQGDAEQAAKTFQDPNWKAAAHYKAERYEDAAKQYEANQLTSADDYYNHGNALAKAGKLDEAIKQYEQALKLQPDFEDAAFNKKVVEDSKQQQQEQQNDDQDKQQDQGDNQDKEKEKDQQKDQQQQDQQGDNKDQSEPEQQDSQDPSKDQPQDKQQEPSDKDKSQNQDSDNKPEQEKEQDGKPESEQEQEQESEQQDKPEAGEPKDEEQTAQEQQQQSLKAAAEQEANKQEKATEQWLRQIPDDPSGLLRRKFDYEYRLRQAEKNTDNEDQPLW
ncbi:VWA domain-containing protein [Dasania marina]|uniref:vWA domain-containing protein n=1 Tax=Dasania marina TaxID=471499 RepID=UPI0030DD36C4|tara:strand:- start:2024 stop:3973 length:1950 start_codon:yes stop_codon:yes gene_type:complete